MKVLVNEYEELNLFYMDASDKVRKLKLTFLIAGSQIEVTFNEPHGKQILIVEGHESDSPET